ncbi:DUF58 domain-containing protein [Alloiococcus sp. CFN-8]|uniref:DUF58 domain-containing protein n=1 Tax=Alloiococcus sp. CFN-8 TaxID=3416081 RepID=UPI003CF24798
MSITKRAVYLFAAGAVLLIPTLLFAKGFGGLPIILFFIYNLALILLIFWDYASNDGKAVLKLRRIGSNKLSLHEEEEISFEVLNEGDRELYVELKDDIPYHHFIRRDVLMKRKLPINVKEVLSYRIIPNKRGAFSFPKVYVRALGKLKLTMKHWIEPLSEEYKVYPNMKNLKKYRVNLSNNRLMREGNRTIKFLGRGTSFESLREYNRGDEYRRINWKATARENKPIVNQYEPEKNQYVYIFIDGGRPMSYTLKGHNKLDMAVNTALVLSDIVNQQGDQTGILLFDTKVQEMLLPGKGPGHRTKILEALYHVEGGRDSSNYQEAFNYFSVKERHRSTIFLFTDFDTYEEAEEMSRVLTIVSKKHSVVVVLIKNENYAHIIDQRATTQEEIFNKGVALELDEERRRIITVLNRRGVFCIECPVEKLEYTVINKYLQMKNRNLM